MPRYSTTNFNAYRDPRDPAYDNPFENFFDKVIEALKPDIWDQAWIESDQACKIIRKAHQDEKTPEQTAELIEEHLLDN